MMTEKHLSDAIFYLFGLIIVLSLLESYFSYKQDKKLYETKDTLTTIYLMGVNFLVNLVMKTGTFLFLDYCYQHYSMVRITNVFWYWTVLVLLQDFLYWLLHTTGHFVRVFWAVHVTHHSSEHFNLTTGFRSSVFEPMYRLFFFVPLALLGFSAIDILFAYYVTQIYGNLVHTQTIGKLHPVIEYIFVTPSHHRVHHASNARYLDKNMGMLLIIWDRMFGTFQEELPEDEVRYGLVKEVEDRGPVNIIFHEFIALGKDMKKTPSIIDKIRYLFNPPGWSHDGNSLTSKDLQKQLLEEENGIYVKS
ncbi:sterol desaturase/sphingolipid hydroxylase (fatty acid hydroxylase superfamily) [Chitinophaga terrae (ex Kim and Jung 2007)]|uniref:sterol desaturase family protein n=1 Tax=Chitinophaga terrae (ex Kim and Jung 2007) TaxID=408074 RepID=UPI00278A1654|nr:sterol desaturase family protein [Chitinophaga terrae (ex Kim and Jung 2007)]MDQ0106222.1 sterol desaturase/sphingolipid hydroxylase (fatty acid hydroxylase superfamily) [Chitinophaga terrae (ex Kim and Jung 2007)]